MTELPDFGAVVPVDPADHDAFCQLFGRYGPHAAKVHDGSQDSDWRLQVLARHRVAPSPKNELKRSSCLVFEGGQLTIRLSGFAQNGSGYFAAKDDALDWDDENYRSVEVPASEFIAIRDWLNSLFPA